MEIESEQPGAGPTESAPAFFDAEPPETQTSEASTTEAAGEKTGLLGDASQSQEAEPTAEELEEIEHEGKKAKVPKEFKDAFLRQQDYTRKTQEVAEQRRTFEAQQQTQTQMLQLREATLQEHAAVLSIDQRLKQFEQVNWDALTESNPQQAIRLEREMRNLQAARQQLSQGIAQKQQAMTFHQQQQSATLVEQGRRELERDIKGWSPDVAGKCLQVAKSFGFRDEELTNVSDPRTVKMLHELLTLRQTVAKQSVKAPPPPLPKPVTKVGGAGATNTKALSDLSAEEWQAKRNERIQSKRR